MDRCRLLTAFRYYENWVSPSLKDRIIAWAEPRIEVLLNNGIEEEEMISIISLQFGSHKDKTKTAKATIIAIAIYRN